METADRTRVLPAGKHVRLQDRINACDLEEWGQLAAQIDSPVFMSPDFIGSVEEAFADQAVFEHAIVDDGAGPVAAASFCSFPIDLNFLVDGSARRLTAPLGKIFPSLVKNKVILCGLPVSVGARQLAIAERAQPADILPLLHHSAMALARRQRAQFIVFKEFDDADGAKLDPLLRLGYRRFSSPPMHRFERPFTDFSAYCAALRSRYRQCVRKSLKKSQLGGLIYERITDTDTILQLYDQSLHRLYVAVATKSSQRLELLPITFFHSLARHFPGRLAITVVRARNRIVAFNWNLLDAGDYHFLFAGIDYELNSDFDLYFNVMYAEMDFAFRLGARKLTLGQTADDFKSRLGCTYRPLSFYAAPVGMRASFILRFAGNMLFPKLPPPPVHHVFPNGLPASGV